MSGNRSCRRELSRFPGEIFSGPCTSCTCIYPFRTSQRTRIAAIMMTGGCILCRETIVRDCENRTTKHKCAMWPVWRVPLIKVTLHALELHTTGALNFLLHLWNCIYFLPVRAFTVLILRVPSIVFKSTLLAVEYIHNRWTKFPPHRKNFCASVVYIFHCMNGWF